MMSAFAFDPVTRRIWVAHASTPDLAFFDVDDPAMPGAVALPAGAALQLAIVDRTLFTVDAAGHLSAVDLTASAPQAQSALDLLNLGGAAVTALGTDGEWLYVADDSARVWRFDPLAGAATVFLGDGARGLDLEATPPGLNRVGGFGYDGARGILFVSDSVENTVIAIQ
jgi:hypothetical protein